MAVSSWPAGFFLTKCSSAGGGKILRESAGWIWLERLLICRSSGTFARAALRRLLCGLNIRLSKRPALRRDDGVLLRPKHSEEKHISISRKECINLEDSIVGKTMQINAATVVGENFQEAGHAPGRVLRQMMSSPARAFRDKDAETEPVSSL